jgi:hypothetical protein
VTHYFSLDPDGVKVHFQPQEVAFLGDILGVLGRLGHPDEDPGAARLDPPAYLEDPEADAEWRRFAGSELSSARRADRSAFEMVIEAVESSEGNEVVISTAEAEAVMRVVNEARLVLAARWGIDSPEAYDDIRPEASDALSFLGWIVSELAMVLGGSLDRP